MATFYKAPYNSASGPDQAWINANAPIIVDADGKSYGAYTRNQNLDVYVAMFDNSGSDNIIICATAAASVRMMAATGYPGFWIEVSTNTTYNTFNYGTYAGGGRTLTALVPKFDSLNDALAYFDVLINTPCVDVANLSGIFVGSTEIQKVILNGATIYQKLPAGCSLSYTLGYTQDSYMYDVDGFWCCFDAGDPGEDSSLAYIDWNVGSGNLPITFAQWTNPFYIYIERDTYSSSDGTCAGTFNGSPITFYTEGSNGWISDALTLVDGPNTLTLTLGLYD